MNKKSIGLLLAGTAFVLGGQAHALTVTGTAGIDVNGQYSATPTAETQTGVNVGVDVDATTSASSSGTMTMPMTGGMPLIQTSADLTTYDNMVVQSQPAVKAINVQSNNTVALTYSQPAKFLGIFSTSLSGQVQVDAQGNTTVHLPWWSFLYTKNTASVQASAAAAVQQSGVQFGTQTDATTQLQNNAAVATAVAAAIQAQASASTTAY